MNQQSPLCVLSACVRFDILSCIFILVLYYAYTVIHIQDFLCMSACAWFPGFICRNFAPRTIHHTPIAMSRFCEYLLRYCKYQQDVMISRYQDITLSRYLNWIDHTQIAMSRVDIIKISRYQYIDISSYQDEIIIIFYIYFYNPKPSFSKSRNRKYLGAQLV